MHTHHRRLYKNALEPRIIRHSARGRSGLTFQSHHQGGVDEGTALDSSTEEPDCKPVEYCVIVAADQDTAGSENTDAREEYRTNVSLKDHEH